MDDQPPKTVIGYAAPTAPRYKQEPSLVGAIFLGLPGWICWLVFLWERLPKLGSARWLTLPGRYLFMVFEEGGMILIWFVAIVAAVVSILHYVPRRKPWYVIGCLITNVAGLVYSCLVGVRYIEPW